MTPDLILRALAAAQVRRTLAHAAAELAWSADHTDTATVDRAEHQADLAVRAAERDLERLMDRYRADALLSAPATESDLSVTPDRCDRQAGAGDSFTH